MSTALSEVVRKTYDEGEFAQLAGLCKRQVRRLRLARTKGFPQPLPGTGRRVLYSAAVVDRYLNGQGV
jgi:hypothetical protein